MTIPLLKSCCFCLRLRTGTLIVGYLHLIGCLFGIVLSTFLIMGGVVVATRSVDAIDELEHGARTEHRSDEDYSRLSLIYGVFVLEVGIILVVLFIVQLIFVIFLLIGGHGGEPSHLKVYLVYSIVMLVIAVILTIVSLIIEPSFIVIAEFIAYVLEVYFLLVIRSYMIKLRDNPEGNRAGENHKP